MIWRTASLGTLPSMLAELLCLVVADPQPFMRMPDIHGDQVVYCCEGDLWIGSISTGSAKRLTNHVGKEIYPRFSPDGKTIAFSASYEGMPEVYTIPVSGGAATRLSFRNDYADPLSWSPDGKTVLYRSRSIPRSYGLYTTPAATGPESKLPIEFASHAVFGPNANQIAFTRFNRWSTAWFHYDGGMQNQIWTGDLATKTFKQITSMPGTNEFPAWEDGNIYFANEREAKFAVYGVPANGGSPKRVAGPYDVEIREINAGPGAIIYERGVGLETMDTKTGTIKALTFRMDSDLLHTRPYTVPAQDFNAEGGISPSGKRVFVETRGQIVSLPVGEGEARLWKSVPGARLRRMRMSPDGQSMAYVSDESGEQQIWISDANGGSPKMITKGAKRQVIAIHWSPDSKKIAYYESGMKLWLIDVATGAETLIVHTGGGQNSHDWPGIPVSFSPDSKWLAYPSFDGITDFGRIHIRNLETGADTLIGSGFTDDDYPSFSKDGKMLAFLSRRSFAVSSDPLQNQLDLAPMIVPCVYLLQRDAENPLKVKDTIEAPAKKEEAPAAPAGFRIDFDGLEGRLIALPVAPGSYNDLHFAGSRVIFSDGQNVSFFDLAAKSGGVLTAGADFQVSADEKKVLIQDRVVDATGKDLPPTAGKVGFGGLRLQIDPVQEWRQIFWDAWRLLRDYFYVENMHGNDWNAIGKKYSAMLPSVRSRDELDSLIRWMQAELGSSHQYLSEGDEQALNKPIAGAFLGADFVADPVAKRLKIAKLFRGDGVVASERSPMLEPGFDVKEGDFLIELAGQPVTDRTNVQAILAGRAGQTVGVTVASKADGSDKRTAFIKPVGSETRMRLMEWVAENRRYVDKASGGKVGYLYVQAMSNQDMTDFVKQYFPQRDKQALIVDTRFNNGGYVQTMINRILETKLSGHFNMRGRPRPWTRQNDYFAGPMACIMNEFNVSCGEEFPARWRDLKLGPIVGRRTYGGEVGSSPGWPLVDGGVVSVPNYGMFTPDGKWAIEGPGVDPDVDVPSDPNAFARGTDPQLDRTIKILLDMVAKKPTTWPMPPTDRVRVKPGGGG